MFDNIDILLFPKWMSAGYFVAGENDNYGTQFYPDQRVNRQNNRSIDETGGRHPSA
jgi:hypothetical protein